MPFSARTKRARWLHGSVGAENKVITERRAKRFSNGPQYTKEIPLSSVDVLPIFFLQHVSEREEHQQKQHHEYAHGLALRLDGLAGVIEKVRDVPDELIILLWLQCARLRPPR